MTSATSFTHSLTVRMPDDMYNWLAEEAHALGNCSKGARIRYHLRNAMQAARGEPSGHISYDTPGPAHHILKEQRAESAG